MSRANILKPNSVHNDWLSAQEIRDLTVDKLLANLGNIADLLKEEAQKAEKQRFPNEAAWLAVRKSGSSTPTSARSALCR